MNPKNIAIRKIKKADNPYLAALIRKVFDEHIAPKIGTVYSDPTTDNLYALFMMKQSILWVAEANNEIWGCCGVYPTNGLPRGYAELVKFYLSAGARGLGIGSKLMKQCIQSSKEFGYTHLYLESMPQFGLAVKIYKRWGFQEIGHALGESGHTSCNIWMRKSLIE